MLLLPATLKVLFFASLLQISLGLRMRGGGRKNKFREKSIIKIPYPTPPLHPTPPCGQLVFRGILGPPTAFPSPTRRERTESYAKPLDGGAPGCGLIGRRTNGVQERVYNYQYGAAAYAQRRPRLCFHLSTVRPLFSIDKINTASWN